MCGIALSASKQSLNGFVIRDSCSHYLCLSLLGKLFPWILLRAFRCQVMPTPFWSWLYSKFAHFVPLRHPYTAASVAKVFMDNIYKLHGLPKSIISDRDRIFTSKLWQLLFKLAGIQLRMSSAYHPQTDGQTERVNQCLKTFLRCFVHACPARWIQWLPLVEFWYNTSTHSALGRIPFEVLYGYPPRH